MESLVGRRVWLPAGPGTFPGHRIRAEVAMHGHAKDRAGKEESQRERRDSSHEINPSRPAEITQIIHRSHTALQKPHPRCPTNGAIGGRLLPDPDQRDRARTWPAIERIHLPEGALQL